MIVSMTRVEVVGSKGRLSDVLNQLQDAGVVHVSHAPLEDAEGVQILESPSESQTALNNISDNNLLERTGELLREMSQSTPREALEDAANQDKSGRLRDEFNSLSTEAIDGQLKVVYPGYSDRTAKLNNLKNAYTNIQNERNRPIEDNKLQRYKMEFHKKFSMSFSCIVFIIL